MPEQITPYIPLIYTFLFAAILVAVVPRKDIRRLSIYGIMFGAIGDVLVIISGKVFGLFEYVNFHPFGFMCIPFFAPISWTIYFMLYFYFMPHEKLFRYIYVASAIGYSIMFGNLLVNMNLMVYHHHRFIMPLITFSLWFILITWLYLMLTNMKTR